MLVESEYPIGWSLVGHTLGVPLTIAGLLALGVVLIASDLVVDVFE